MIPGPRGAWFDAIPRGSGDSLLESHGQVPRRPLPELRRARRRPAQVPRRPPGALRPPARSRASALAAMPAPAARGRPGRTRRVCLSWRPGNGGVPRSTSPRSANIATAWWKLSPPRARSLQPSSPTSAVKNLGTGPRSRARSSRHSRTTRRPSPTIPATWPACACAQPGYRAAGPDESAPGSLATPDRSGRVAEEGRPGTRRAGRLLWACTHHREDRRLRRRRGDKLDPPSRHRPLRESPLALAAKARRTAFRNATVCSLPRPGGGWQASNWPRATRSGHVLRQSRAAPARGGRSGRAWPTW